MLTIPTFALFLISTLASASPQLNLRSDNTSHKVFNTLATLQERDHIALKYANIEAKAAAVNADLKRNNKKLRGTADDRSRPYDLALARLWATLGFRFVAYNLIFCLAICFQSIGVLCQDADQSGAVGTIATDTIYVAGLTVANQGFGAINQEFGGFGHGPNAGLLGLRFTANSESGATPFSINLCQSKSLASNVFSFYMSRNGGTGSELCIGLAVLIISRNRLLWDWIPWPPAARSYTGTSLYVGLILVESTGLTYSNISVGSTFSAVIDSGTTVIYFAPDIAAALYSQASLSRSMPGANPDYYRNSLDCVGDIVGQSVGSGLAILGDEFMKNVYSVFDYNTMQVGFAALTSN
ncbi:Type I transmembrane sorting receptor [Tulasnella sp. 331]|nr:Type I transmembrane sorting receptor [Tulasnella sp. 331]